MSRTLEPLYGAPARRWERRADVLLTTGGYVADGQEVHHLIAVVLLDDALRSRLVLPALVGHLSFSTDTHACFELSDAPRQLQRLLAGYPSCAASLVVVLPDAGISGDEIDAIAEPFIEASNLTLRHVVGVAEEPARWKTLRHVQRFVATALCGHTLAVRSLFQTLGAIMAPVAILEADDDEIEQCLGTASAPSFFVHARWNAEPGLEVSEDFRPVSKGVSTSMVTMLDSPSVAIARSVLEQWERLAPGQSMAFGSAPRDFYSPDRRRFLGPDGDEVIILCRPGVGATPADA